MGKLLVSGNVHEQLSSLQPEMKKKNGSVSRSVVSDYLRPHQLWPTWLLCLWNSPGQEHWSGLLFPSPGDPPHPGIKPRSPALQQILYHLGHQRILVSFIHRTSPQYFWQVICQIPDELI